MLEAKRAMVQVNAQLLRTLLEGIANLDSKIEEAANPHPDFFIFESLPGAGQRVGAALIGGVWFPTRSLWQRRGGTETIVGSRR